MSGYDFKKIEDKWQKSWEESQPFSVDKNPKNPFYVLEMFPYPSGVLHVGHVRNYVLGDVLARFKKAQGFDVLHPMGWDAFGLPAENAAITHNTHPRTWTHANIQHMRKQFKRLGLGYDWSREFATCDESYFMHEQEMFIRFWKENLLVRKEGVVNWDPIDQTILANEQIENGRGWRSGALIEKKKMRQWFVRQSDFAEELLASIKDLDEWPAAVRTMQENWIGYSEGAIVRFSVKDRDSLEVFSTRPETLYGATFCAVSVEHPLAEEAASTHKDVADFITHTRAHPFDEQSDQATQEGVKLSFEACHPLTKELLPIYVVNYVLSDYGTGAIFACPAHDERDFAFAKRYNERIQQVIAPAQGEWSGEEALVVPRDDIGGTLIHSKELNGLSCASAFERVTETLIKQGLGAKQERYRLRDWCVSRQRYWGTPIPMILCDDCGEVPVPVEDLPVSLPQDIVFDGQGNPLDKHPTWKHVSCPQCAKPAVRDTDTLDTFFESCWYYLRFISQPKDRCFDPKEVEQFLPIDWYIGGVEHAVMHLLYVRLFMIMLVRAGYLKPIKTPIKRLLTQGMICHRTYRTKDKEWVEPKDVKKQADGTWALKDGTPVTEGASEKMSKSKKNVVDPDSIMEAYGVDALRMFVVSDAPPERHFDWSDTGLHGSWRFAKKLYAMMDEWRDDLTAEQPKQEMTQEFLVLMHKTIAAVTDDLEAMRLHLAIAHIRALFNAVTQSAAAGCMQNLWHGWRALLLLLDPFMPHLSAELREQCSVESSWPSYNKNYLVADMVTVAVQVNGKMRGTVEVALNAAEQDVLQEAQNIIARTIGNQPVRKVIFVMNRIVNVIV
ncbi:MAG: leucine--tRNA ligase [Alphaproteobacteria bacterium]|nr:leucine--tRNA ligase [Alphaproteobacteria bacterium]